MPAAVVLPPQADVVSKNFVKKLHSTYGRVPFAPADGFVPETTQALGNFLECTTDGEAAYVDMAGGGAGRENSNMKSNAHNLTVTNIRDHQPKTTLECEGITYVDFPSHLTEEDLLNENKEWVKNKVETDFWQECSDLIKKNTNAVEVYPYHWLHRRTPENLGIEVNGKNISGKPNTHFHIDNDATTAEGNLRARIGDEEAERWLAQPHWGIINVWKPIGDPASQFPLAMLDMADLNWETDVEVILTKNNYKKNINAVKYDDKYKYYYVKDLRPDETLLFRDFDSREGGLIGVPHGAISDSNSPKGGPLRRSIEVRCLVLFKD